MAASLSDAELRAALTDLGVNPGPIVASTRSLWAKKLEKLQGGGQAAAKKGKSRAAAGSSPAREPARTRVPEPSPEGRRGRGRPRKASPSPARPAPARKSPSQKKRDASDSEDQESDFPRRRNLPAPAGVGDVPKAATARRGSPAKKTPAFAASSDLIPGELNLSRSGGRKSAEGLSASPKKGESFLSRLSFLGGRKSGGTERSADVSAFGYSDADSDDNDLESPSRVDRSINTSFPSPPGSTASFSSRRSVVKSNSSYVSPSLGVDTSATRGGSQSSISYLNGLSRRSINVGGEGGEYSSGLRGHREAFESRRSAYISSRPVVESRRVEEERREPSVFLRKQHDYPPRKSPIADVLASLNRFRENAMRKIHGFAYGRPQHLDFDDEVQDNETFVSRSGGSSTRPLRFRGAYESKVQRQFSLNLPAQTSRILLGILLGFLLILALGYLGSAYRTEVKASSRVLWGAAKDTAGFIYNNMILPILAVSFVVGVIGSIYWYRKHQIRVNAEHKRTVFEMVDKIIGILRKHHMEEVRAGRTGDKESCLPIPHIRDMLISPAQRTSLIPIWEEAQVYVTENESRVQCETELVGGQNCMVWRWVQPHGTVTFSEDQVRMNAPPKPYSECLKLRGMFDPEEEEGDDWPSHIQDALLEKLGPSIHAMHIAVDKRSKEGCVYMKLETKDMAGKAFSTLHGSWFDNRLVSVKYLRTQRYGERFPEAMKAIFPLEVKKPRHSMP